MTHAAQEPTVPVACAGCGSDRIKGPDQPATGLSYWRCLKCGIVWNPERPPDRSSTFHSSISPRSNHERGNGDYWKNR
jgi:hypothetical protein